MNRNELAGMMDHTQLKPFATREMIETLCREAKEIGAASVCVNPCNVALAAELLEGSGVAVCTVIGFPLGANTKETKAFETRDAIQKGAEEVDMVVNVGALKSGDEEAVFEDILAVVDAAQGRLVKVILETCFLTDEEKVTACRLAARAGADYVKTSTGFGTGGATPRDVELMRAAIPDSMKVKAAGGIHNWEEARAMIDAGADRLGVSASLAILDSLDEGDA